MLTTSEAHLKLELPFDFVEENLRQQGVSVGAFKSFLTLHETYPDHTHINPVFWRALEHLYSHPQCTLLALLSTPFIVRNNPTFDPTSSCVWPVLVAMFNGCLPTRHSQNNAKTSVQLVINPHSPPRRKSRNLHINILSSLLLCPLNENMLSKLRWEVFSHWDHLRWSELFEALHDWSSVPKLLEDFDTLAYNIQRVSQTSDCIRYWVDWACTAAESGETLLVAAIVKHFKNEITQYVNNNIDNVFSPHVMKSRIHNSQKYKIWRVALFLGSYNHCVWGNPNIYDVVVPKTIQHVAEWHHNFKEGKNIKQWDKQQQLEVVQECSAIETVLKHCNQEHLCKRLKEMQGHYTYPLDALEFLLSLELDVNEIVHMLGGDMVDHPLCLASYQNCILHDAVKNEEACAKNGERKL